MTKENPAGPGPRSEAGAISVRPRVVSWVLRPESPPLWLGVAVAMGLITLETALVFTIERIGSSDNAFGALFLVGVLVVSANWGFGLALATTLVSSMVYMYFHLGEDGFVPTEKEDWIAVLIFVPIALLANLLVGQARLRAAEANQRRREAEASREQLRLLAEQQAALRRVATLVAQGVPAAEVFSAVTYELAKCLGQQHTALVRFEAGGASVLIAYYDEPAVEKQLGERYPLDNGGVAAKVYRTGRPARMDSQDVTGLAALRSRQMDLGSVVAVPIVVDGQLWGAALGGTSQREALAPDTETRMQNFADLVATAISNAEARSQLTASRTRIVTAADDARRRLERDLHDGAQQRLVSLGLELRAAESSLRTESSPVAEQISQIVSGLTHVSDELREISRGIHPAILSKGGLAPALKALARRSAVPVEVDLAVDGRLPDSVEVAAYFLVAESLTNVAKHAQAAAVTVSAETDSGHLHLTVRDDGVGGADAGKGSGLIGLIDRVEALGGRFDLSSPAGGGTSLHARIPLEAHLHR